MESNQPKRPDPGFGANTPTKRPRKDASGTENMVAKHRELAAKDRTARPTEPAAHHSRPKPVPSLKDLEDRLEHMVKNQAHACFPSILRARNTVREARIESQGSAYVKSGRVAKATRRDHVGSRSKVNRLADELNARCDGVRKVLGEERALDAKKVAIGGRDGVAKEKVEGAALRMAAEEMRAQAEAGEKAAESQEVADEKEAVARKQAAEEEWAEAQKAQKAAEARKAAEAKRAADEKAAADGKAAQIALEKQRAQAAEEERARAVQTQKAADKAAREAEQRKAAEEERARAVQAQKAAEEAKAAQATRREKATADAAQAALKEQQERVAAAQAAKNKAAPSTFGGWNPINRWFFSRKPADPASAQEAPPAEAPKQAADEEARARARKQREALEARQAAEEVRVRAEADRVQATLQQEREAKQANERQAREAHQASTEAHHPGFGFPARPPGWQPKFFPRAPGPRPAMPGHPKSFPTYQEAQADLERKRRENAARAEAAKQKQQRDAEARGRAAAQAEKLRQAFAQAEDLRRARLAEEQRGDAVGTWLASINVLKNPASLTSFPAPPAMPCRDLGCQASAGTRALEACSCSIRHALSRLDRAGLKSVRLMFHPDKFSCCAESVREAYQAMAREVFVVADAMFKDAR